MQIDIVYQYGWFVLLFYSINKQQENPENPASDRSFPMYLIGKYDSLADDFSD